MKKALRRTFKNKLIEFLESEISACEMERLDAVRQRAYGEAWRILSCKETYQFTLDRAEDDFEG